MAAHSSSRNAFLVALLGSKYKRAYYFEQHWNMFSSSEEPPEWAVAEIQLALNQLVVAGGLPEADCPLRRQPSHTHHRRKGWWWAESGGQGVEVVRYAVAGVGARTKVGDDGVKKRVTRTRGRHEWSEVGVLCRQRVVWGCVTGWRHQFERRPPAVETGDVCENTHTAR
ncbi:hypothetical protein Salat_1881100 [Sesamum alatum]|uniref:Uncharacterized protein n=1 Tax=Sesamum alatum TaxID=300844 RepID=A0AAE1Y3I5_9LAMI|nr:hypothetical protein Salat_1881100 [Sesamum alatum]